MANEHLQLLAIPGVSAASNQKIVDALQEVLGIKKVVLFGSRAMGNFKSGSDVDLCLFGEDLKLINVTQLKSKLDDANIPYEMDICLWDHLDSVALREHIQSRGIELKII